MTTQPSRTGHLAEISVRNRDWPAWLGVSAGVVLIDGRRAGLLIGGKPKTFRVGPGRHEVVVRTEMNAAGPVDLEVEAGDRVALACSGLRASLVGAGALVWPLVIAGAVAAAYAGRAGQSFWKDAVYATLNHVPMSDERVVLAYGLAPRVTSTAGAAEAAVLAWLALVAVAARFRRLRFTAGLGRDKIGPRPANLPWGPEGPGDPESNPNHCVQAASRARRVTRSWGSLAASRFAGRFARSARLEREADRGEPGPDGSTGQIVPEALSNQCVVAAAKARHAAGVRGTSG